VRLFNKEVHKKEVHMDQDRFNRMLGSFKADLETAYKRELLSPPKFGRYTVREYEGVRDVAIVAMLTEHTELKQCYDAFMTRLNAVSHRALSETDPIVKQGHRVWAAMGQVGRGFKMKAIDARSRKKSSQNVREKEVLPVRVTHKPRVAARIVRKVLAGADGPVFIPDVEILQLFTEIAASSWENAILSQSGYELSTCDHGYMLEKAKPDEKVELQEAFDKLQKSLNELKARMA